MNKLPYNEIFPELLYQIHRALGYCYSIYSKDGILSETDKGFDKFFKNIEKKYNQTGLNRHLVKGLSKTEQDRYNIFPRLAKITIHAFLNTQQSKVKSKNYKAFILPSPLNIIYQALTVPSEPQTAAYPFVLCRSMLFYFLNLHPKHPDLEELAPHFHSFSEEDVLNSLSSFKNYIKVQARWPDPRLRASNRSSRINFLNGHILSIKGITHLWFNDERELVKFCKVPAKLDRSSDLNSRYSYPKYQFRLSGSYTELPDSAEILNFIFGIPLPLRGADILFHGGLKKTASSGLVISVHGQPGTGKTSFAISLSAALSPFKTTTIYLSLEEEKEDLQAKLYTLIPDYLKDLSVYTKPEFLSNGERPLPNSQTNWFNPFKIKTGLTINELTELLKLLYSDLISKRQTRKIHHNSHNVALPAICPLLLVIDNINELFADPILGKEKYDDLEKFIEQCRNMGALVLLIAADDIPKKVNLDYFVDVSIHLCQTSIDKQYEKPIRIFQLIKTRHQVSRQGSHVFHISNSRGFRISPQVPSQMDKREKIRILLPSEDKFIHTLNIIYNNGNYKYNSYLPISCQSQILIHGYGSSGKAGFGLKLLLTPFLPKKVNLSDENKIIFTEKKGARNKVLIVSFLYPEEYYETVYNKIKKQISSEGLGNCDNSYHVKAFYPGFLTPEDFVYKIVRLLDEANLEGEPFTGILLDGLHNVFLQFKNLQESHMIWPLLYSILSRYQLTVVSTFTNFSFNERHTNRNLSDLRNPFQTPDDFVLMQQGQKPFLHGLVKAADYYLQLEEIIDDRFNYERRYWLSVRSSIRQTPPKDFLEWDRINLRINRIIPSNEIYNKTETDIKGDKSEINSRKGSND